MAKNTGTAFEDKVYTIIEKEVQAGKFLLSNPNLRVCRKPQYYSRDREDMIICDISVEKYLADPNKDKELRPSIIVIIECKDYSGKISVDEVEEFHTKLQQIGADNTKGIMITCAGVFQKSALTFAHSKGIALARILPDDQIKYIMSMMINTSFSNVFVSETGGTNAVRALTEQDYISMHGEDFFTLTGENTLGKMVARLLNED